DQKLLTEGLHHPLIRDIAAQNFFHVAALLARHQCGRVHFWKDLLGGEGIGEQLAAFYPLPYVSQQPQQILVPLPLDQKIQRCQDWQSRLNQRQKLLVEDQKRRLFQLAAAPPNWPPPL